MILSDFIKALEQIGDPRFRRVLGLGVGLSFLLLFAVYALFIGAIPIERGGARSRSALRGRAIRKAPVKFAGDL